MFCLFVGGQYIQRPKYRQFYHRSHCQDCRPRESPGMWLAYFARIRFELQQCAFLLAKPIECMPLSVSQFSGRFCINRNGLFFINIKDLKIGYHTCHEQMGWKCVVLGVMFNSRYLLHLVVLLKQVTCHILLD